MHKILIFIVTTLAMSLLAACGKFSKSQEDNIQATADSFATNYYTWHFDKAMKFATDEMKKEISFISSNVHKSDIEKLKNTTFAPNIETGEITIIDESTAKAELSLSNVFLMDSLGKEAHLYEQAKRTIYLKRCNECWLVDETWEQ